MKHLHTLAAFALLTAILVPAQPASARPMVDPRLPTASQAHERRALDVAQQDHNVRYWEARAVKDRIRKGQATCQDPSPEAQAICASTHRLQEETQR